MSKYIDIEYLKKKKRFLTAQQRYIVRMTDIYTAPSIDLADYVPKEFHDKTCEAMAKAHQEEIADMVRVVRCKECRYCKRKRYTFNGLPIIFYRCTENNRDVESDDYCSWGERSRR